MNAYLGNPRFSATVFVDSYRVYTHVYLQENLSSNLTLDAKLAYERKACLFCVKVSGYHAENGCFAENAWKQTSAALQQSLMPYTTGLKALADFFLPYALKYACDLRNKYRYYRNSTPENIFSGVTSFDPSKLQCFQPFGYQVYVLDDGLQGNTEIPCWDLRSRVGVCLRHYPHPAQSVALVLNLTTEHVSPQYRMVFDDDFTIVGNLKLGTVSTNWPDLYENRRELLTDEPFHLVSDWTELALKQP